MIDSAISSLEKPQLLEIIQQLQSQNQKLQDQIDKLLRTVFGKKSERFIPQIPEQTELPLDIKKDHGAGSKNGNNYL